MQVDKGSQDVAVATHVLNTDGTSKTDVVAGAGVDIKYQIENGAVQTLASVSGMSAGTHVDGGFYHAANGRYMVGLPDSVVASEAVIRVWLDVADTEVIESEVQVVETARQVLSRPLRAS